MSNENYDVNKMLSHTMAQTTSRIRSENVQNKANDGKTEETFHQKERARALSATKEMKDAAEKEGRANAATFIQSVRNPNHHLHDANVRIFKSKYNSSEREVQDDHIAEAMRKHNLHPVEHRDLGFESRTLEACAPKGNERTHTGLAHFDILKNSLNEEWMKRGYKGTQAVIDAWKAKYKN